MNKTASHKPPPICITASCSVGSDFDFFDEGYNVHTIESAALYLEEWAGTLRKLAKTEGID